MKMRTNLSTQVIKSLKEVAHIYKGVLIDQFGVLHDGHKPYPGAVNAVKQLHDAGLHLFIISNSSRRASDMPKKLSSLGFQEEWFKGGLTSGELTHRYLQSRPDAWWQGLGTRCMHFTWEGRGTISLEGLGLEVVSRPEEADFLLVHGTEALAQPDSPDPVLMPLQQLLQLVRQCAEHARAAGKRLPMIVANPDKVAPDAIHLKRMPGTLAAEYAAAGGEVRLMGKPDGIIYQACMQALGLPAEQVLAIGDSLEHDIAGACSAGVDSVLIAGGIHRTELLRNNDASSNGNSSSSSSGGARGGQTASEPYVDEGSLSALCQMNSAIPTYAVPYLNW